MSSILNLFLKTELTCIPRLLNKYIGNYYDNALCNGATWMFLIWNILHYSFDKVFDAFFHRIGCKEYLRKILLRLIWYLSFHSIALGYSIAIFKRSQMELFNFKKMHVPSHVVSWPSETTGSIVICTFFLHSAFWELIRKKNPVKMVAYLALTIFFICSFILRIVEVSITLTGLISVVRLVEELTKFFFLSYKSWDSLCGKIAAINAVLFEIFVVLGVNGFVIPMTFLIPMVIKIIPDYPNTLFITMMCALFVYLLAEIYKSILWMLARHWIYHMQEDKANSCQKDIFECCMLEERDDFSHELQRFRNESKRRGSELMSLRKPKNRNLLFLKCMVSIKKKLDQKKRNRSDNSDSDSEKSEDDCKCLADNEEIIRDLNELDSVEDKEDDDLNLSKEMIGDCLRGEKQDLQDDFVTKDLPKEEIQDKAHKE